MLLHQNENVCRIHLEESYFPQKEMFFLTVIISNLTLIPRPEHGCDVLKGGVIMEGRSSSRNNSIHFTLQHCDRPNFLGRPRLILSYLISPSFTKTHFLDVQLVSKQYLQYFFEMLAMLVIYL